LLLQQVQITLPRSNRTLSAIQTFKQKLTLVKAFKLENMDWIDTYDIVNADKVDTPFLAVYPDIIKENIKSLIRLFKSTDQIRPHVKTHKCPQVVRLLLDAGITKFKCATIAEAEMLALAGAPDVLMAYQPVGPKIDRFMQLMVAFPACTLSCLVDNELSARQISNQASQLNVTVNIWIDLNVGMNRTGIASNADAKELVDLCSRLPHVKVVGFHAYDGHITDADQHTRHHQAKRGFDTVKSLVDELAASVYPDLRIVAGSTPTIAYYAQQPGVECSPGTFIYWDQHYQHLYPELPFKNAAVVVTRVISKPEPYRVCLDLGYKAISSESPATERVDFPQHPDATVISQSEEHLLVEVKSTELQTGDTVYGLPYHIGRTCNLYEGCAVVDGGRITGNWLHTARKR
jgi:D-serine deaminase-like pyridoxal phosphate-dependent protein